VPVQGSDAVSSACRHDLCPRGQRVDAPLTPQGMRIRDVQSAGPPFMSVEMALEIWKWRLSWTSSISSRAVGNDFQEARGNKRNRDFQMSTIFTPYGGPACPEHGRLPEAAGVIGRPRRCRACDPFGVRSHHDRVRQTAITLCPECSTFRPEHLSGWFRPMRSSGCWRSTDFTWRRNITKATARISHQPI